MTESSYTSWQSIDWKSISKFVLETQVEIFKACQAGDKNRVHELQMMLIKHQYVKLLATRRVTQDNRGRRTAGIDKISKIEPKDRLDFAYALDINGSCSRIRRIYISKPNGEKRPLGIPTIEDRAKQAILKIALEPEWEAKFESDRYGFRPGRSSQNALTSIHNALFQKDKYVLDADIKKCFDRIDHNTLINKLDTFPLMENQIKAWLKAGLIDELNNLTTDKNIQGTPQGGIISPLLCNITFHGIEEAGMQAVEKFKGSTGYKKPQIRAAYKLVRYADDFVVFHPMLEVIIAVKDAISKFLAPLNLEYHPDKTRIAHTRINHDGQQPGFTFLGTRFVHHTTKKHGQKTKNSGNRGIGYVLKSSPDSEAIKNHIQEIRSVVKKNKWVTQIELIKLLNPKIRGWTNYYAKISHNDAFGYCDNKMFWILYKWGLSRHPSKGKIWVAEKYFHTAEKLSKKKDYNFSPLKKWIFGVKYQGYVKYQLRYHRDQGLIKSFNLARDFSPYNPKYYRKHTEIWFSQLKDRMYKRQNGICRVCLGPILHDDFVEIHHILPKGVPERDKLSMMWLIHNHCHDKIHSKAGDTCVEEEPYDA